jgi:hypothetical protein
VTGVVRYLVMTRSTVQAWMTVTLIDAVLTVGAGVPAIHNVQNLGSNSIMHCMYNITIQYNAVFTG